METPLISAAVQVVIGALLVFGRGVLIGELLSRRSSNIWQDA
jgi:hypothetical protein